MAHPAENVAAIILVVVGIATFAITVISIRAQLRTGNSNLKFISAAFGLFTIKAFVNAWALKFNTIAHEHLELVSSGFDLAIVALVAAPLIFRHG